MPIEILREESNDIKKAISRKLNKQKTGKKKIQDAAESLSKSIGETSKKLIQPISDELKKLSHNEIEIELITPSHIEDLISSSGYFLQTNHVRVRDIYQGSGIQSFLMFHTLNLIDKDYAQQFGWKQATIWAVEEPESSLHSDLEARLALFLIKIVTNEESRLQLFCTTHSTMFAEYSQLSALVEKKLTETECDINNDPKILFRKIAKAGISRHTHPVLFYPRQNILLCEGKIDIVFLEKTFEVLEIDKSKMHITCLSDLMEKENMGGVATVIKYIENNRDVILYRYKNYHTKIIALFDWEENNKIPKNIKEINGVSIIQWPEDKVKEKTKKIKGVESLYPERFFKEAMAQEFKSILSQDGDHNYAYSVHGQKGKDAKGKLKLYLSELVKQDLAKEDVGHLREFIEQNIIPDRP